MTRLRQGFGGQARLLELSEIVQLLAGRAEELARALLPRGRREGAEWVEASTRAGGLGDSLKVHLTGPRAGVWSHFGAGRGGDALDLVAYLETDGDKRRAVAWAKRWLGLEAADPATLKTRRRQAAEAQAKARRRAAEEDELKRRRAQALWLSSVESLKDTAAARYLAGRGIELARLGRQPRALRFHPECFNVESNRAWPALLAAIVDGKGCHVATHRTWLEVHGDGRVTKAPLANPKMTIGRYRGGAVRLWRGLKADGKRSPPLARVKPGSSVLLCEGLEDGLTLALALPERRILAAVSLANMAALDLPEAIAEVVIVADNDAAGSQAAQALDRAVARFLGQGRQVRLARPPAAVKDVNALLVRDQESGIRDQKGGAA